MHKLNVFKFGISESRNPAVWWINIKCFFRNIKYAWQRCTRGFCDYDLYDLELYYTQLICDSLLRFATSCHGWPRNSEFKTHHDWACKLFEIANLLEHSMDFDENSLYKNEFLAEFGAAVDSDKYFNNDEFKQIRDKYFKREEEIYKLRLNDKKEALTWIRDHIDML